MGNFLHVDNHNESDPKMILLLILIVTLFLFNCRRLFSSSSIQGGTNKIYTEFAQSSNAFSFFQQNIIEIQVKVGGRINEDLVVCAEYSKREKIGMIFDAITKHLHQKYYPKLFVITSIDYGFLQRGLAHHKRVDRDHIIYVLAKASILKYSRNEIVKKQLCLHADITYHHKINDIPITCPMMLQKKSMNPLQCSVYYAVKEKSESNKQNYDHLMEFNHFQNEIRAKPKCKYYETCFAFNRLENGGNEIKDQCHLKIYRHPPRARNIELAKNMHAFVFQEQRQKVHPLYKPKEDEPRGLQQLIDEVIKNKFKYDLCLECSQGDDCKHNDYSILKVVDEKMQCFRHKAIGSPLTRKEMLALVLYTGCDCNYDLCSSQRNGNYEKWKWFDYFLASAIFKLSLKETGNFDVYSGLNSVQLDKNSVKSGFFVTYVSTTWDKNVAMEFMGGDKGMVIDICHLFASFGSCCDVSWISKFPDEREILFSRHCKLRDCNFDLSVVDQSNGVQTVRLNVHGFID